MAELTINLTEPHTGQARVLRNARRFNVLKCGRRFGKTALGVQLAAEAATRGEAVGWFAPTYTYLDDPWRDLLRTLEPIVRASNKMEKRIHLTSGGTVDFWTIDNPDAGRGRKYHVAIVDEGGIARNLKDAWQGAIRPTLTDYRGSAWFLGTPKGNNYFTQLFSKAESSPDWASFQMGTADNPFIDPDEIEAARAELPQSVFEQEYLGIPADDGGNPFGLQCIRACIGELSEKPPVVFGVDLAKSYDWTVLVGLDADGAVCHLDRWQGDWGATERKILAVVNGWPTLVDNTGVGNPVVEAMKRVRDNVEGYTFTSTSKQHLMGGLASAIHQGAVTFPDGWLVSELEAFEYQYTAGGVKYSAPPGLHDDGVCALALAWRQFSEPRAHFAIAPPPVASHRDDWEDW